jgi:hypothetical protein
MDIHFAASMGMCSNFLDENGNTQELSIVIAPIKFVQRPNDPSVQVKSGCSLWEACYNKSCWYSESSREAYTPAADGKNVQH